jgi:hypothetical protein
LPKTIDCSPNNSLLSWRKENVQVVFDAHERTTPWKCGLFDHMMTLRQRHRITVVLVSKHYARKRWTTFECRAAQAHAMHTDPGRILPVYLDATVIPGMTVGENPLTVQDGIQLAAHRIVLQSKSGNAE